MRRTTIAFILLSAVIGVLVLRLAYIVLIERDALVAQSKARTVRIQLIPARRGSILDRNERTLASSALQTTIGFLGAHCHEDVARRELNQLRRALQPQHDLPMLDLETLRGDRRYQVIARGLQVTPDELRSRVGATLTCFHFERTWARVPFAPRETAPFLGAVDYEHTGVTGLEKSADELLHAKDGSQRTVRSIRGDILRVFEDASVDAIMGTDVATSIDRSLQESVTQIAVDEAKRAALTSAWVLVYRPQDGEILAFGAANLSPDAADVLFAGAPESDFFESLLFLLATAHVAPVETATVVRDWLAPGPTGESWRRMSAGLERAAASATVNAYCKAVGLPRARSMAEFGEPYCDRISWRARTWTGLAMFGALVNEGRSVDPTVLATAGRRQSPPRRYLSTGVANFVRRRLAEGSQPPFVDFGLLGYEAGGISMGYRYTKKDERAEGLAAYVVVNGAPIVITAGATQPTAKHNTKDRTLIPLVRAVQYASIRFLEQPSEAQTSEGTSAAHPVPPRRESKAH